MLIQPYSSSWVENFIQLKSKLDAGLKGLAYRIEHVGSTAVPNLDAKPIIDIDIIYYNDVDFGSIKQKLERIGYYHNGNQGIQDRDVFKRNGNTFCNILDTISHHLYVCPSHSKALERHIFSRDYFRKNEWARIKYQEMKYELAMKAKQNKKIYATLKEIHVNEFIDAIIEREKKNQ